VLPIAQQVEASQSWRKSGHLACIGLLCAERFCHIRSSTELPLGTACIPTLRKWSRLTGSDRRLREEPIVTSQIDVSRAASDQQPVNFQYGNNKFPLFPLLCALLRAILDPELETLLGSVKSGFCFERQSAADPLNDAQDNSGFGLWAT
jgi:hypothetical protein